MICSSFCMHTKQYLFKTRLFNTAPWHHWGFILLGCVVVLCFVVVFFSFVQKGWFFSVNISQCCNLFISSSVDSSYVRFNRGTTWERANLFDYNAEPRIG